MVQVTNLPVGRFVSLPSINADAHYLTFGSNGDLGGLNPTPIPNVFVCELPTGLFTRITADSGFDPTISGDGRWVAFTSSADYTGRNEDGSDEIFRYDRVRHKFSQLTKDKLGDGSSALPAINGKGNRVAFETSSNLRRRNPDFSNEVYLFNRSGNLPLTIDREGDGESHSPAISADGLFVAFTSTSNLTGRNEDLSQELMVYDVKEHDVSQVTNDPEGNGESSSPAVSGDGRFVAFISSSNVDGLNPDGFSAVCVMNRARHFTVISKTPDGLFDGDTPALSDDGRWVAFVSGYDVTLGNPDHNSEILLYDRERKTFAQATDTTGCANFNPKISGDGTRIAYLSQCNPTGGNADRNVEVFVADNPALNLVIHSEGPVSLVVRDPKGLMIGPSSSTIPRATYEQDDFDGDGVGEDRVTIPQALEGAYRVQVVPDVGAPVADPVTVEATLNDVTAPLAEDSVGNLTAVELSFSNQGFSRRSSRLTPSNGDGSAAFLSARLLHVPAARGPMRVRFTDGISAALFDFGRIENLPAYGVGRVFKGVVNGFATKLRVLKRLNDTSTISLSAKDGDLSMFTGTGDISMTIVVQIGSDTDMYHWRFKRRLSGQLILK